MRRMCLLLFLIGCGEIKPYDLDAAVDIDADLYARRVVDESNTVSAARGVNAPLAAPGTNATPDARTITDAQVIVSPASDPPKSQDALDDCAGKPDDTKCAPCKMREGATIADGAVQFVYLCQSGVCVQRHGSECLSYACLNPKGPYTVASRAKVERPPFTCSFVNGMFAESVLVTCPAWYGFQGEKVGESKVVKSPGWKCPNADFIETHCGLLECSTKTPD